MEKYQGGGRPAPSSQADNAYTSAAPIRPGWPEIAVGLLGIIIVGLAGGAGLARIGLDPIVLGLIFTALSGIGGMAGFGAAFCLRIRRGPPFGMRPTTGRWLAIGASLGLVTFLAKSLAILAYISVTGDERAIQGIYAAGASGGIWTVIAATFFLGIITPIGEEFLFRGVVTNALLRYGPFTGVIGGALIFALFHGINAVFPAALMVGLASGELFRRSGSIWPGVTLHAVVNLPTIPVMILASPAA